jgi:hypothetical protein
MISQSRLILRVVAAATVAAAFSMTPARATESLVAANEHLVSDAAVPVAEATTPVVSVANDAAAVPATAAADAAGPSTSRAMASTAYPAKRNRTATARSYRTAASASTEARGSDAWYRRHFVLMIGVAY